MDCDDIADQKDGYGRGGKEIKAVERQAQHARLVNMLDIKLQILKRVQALHG